MINRKASISTQTGSIIANPHKLVRLDYCFHFHSDVDKTILSWKNTSTLWLHGYWSYDWADNYVRVQDVSSANTTITVSDKTSPLYGIITFVLKKIILYTITRFHS